MAATIIQQKRFTNEKTLLAKEPLHYTTAYPDKDNSLIWYCLIIGQKGTPYYGGHYVYKVVHSPKYPAEPPDYYFLTPSGRYEVDKKICLTNSSYHKGEWSSTWNIKTILISFYSIFLDEKEHGISHRHDSPEICKDFAKKSIDYNKKYHGEIYNKFDFTYLSDDVPVVNKSKPTSSTLTGTTVSQVSQVHVSPVKKEQEDTEKNKQYVKTSNIKVLEENNVNNAEHSEYDKLLNNIKNMDTELEKQFAHIKNLEKTVKLSK